jgi:hypothetical protein
MTNRIRIIRHEASEMRQLRGSLYVGLRSPTNQREASDIFVPEEQGKTCNFC